MPHAPVRKAVFPVAGLGTRFLPATKMMAKEMLPLVDMPLIQNAVEEAKAAGIEEFIFVTSRGKSMLEDQFDVAPDLMALLESRGKTAEMKVVENSLIPSGKLMATRQSRPLGLGHAVWCARAMVGDEPFAVLLPDDVILSDTPCLKQMVDVYNQTGGNILAVVDVPREHTSRYGILDVESDDGRIAKVRGLVEKPKPEDAPSTLSVIGRYILQPGVFKELEQGKKGAGGEIQLTDGMAAMLGREDFWGYRFKGKRYDCGDKVGFIEANVAFALKRADIGEKVRAAITALL